MSLSGSLRVALLVYRGKPHCGGQGIYTRHLSAALTDLGHHVEVFSGPPYPELDERVQLHRVPSLDLYREPDPFRIPHPREFKTRVDALEFALMCTAGFPEPLTFSLRVRRALRERRHDFDVIHDNQSLGTGLLDLVDSGVPVLATIHHPITVDRRVELAHAPNPIRNLTLRRWYGFTRMQSRVAQRLPRIVTVSDSSASDIVADHGVDRDRIRVVPVGVDPERFRPMPSVERVPGRIMTTASADVAMKGLTHLLEAVAKVRTERPELELVVIGKPVAEGPVARTLDRLALHDAVRFVSGVTDERIVELYAEAEVAVVPSLYEGFSLPAVEAMACGVPLVSTTGGALPEVVGSDGRTAVLVPPGDPGALATALKELLDDPARRATMGAAGRERAVGRYSWRATAEATAEQYREVIALVERAHRVLTVRYERLGLRSGERLLDLGCGGGRHAYEAGRLGARVAAADMDLAELKEVRQLAAGMREAGELTTGSVDAVGGDALRLPFPDGAFDRVVASEVMEHIPDDRAAADELARVLRPGGTLAVTVPSWLPEQICWRLSDEYHAPFVPGGHVRIYTKAAVCDRLRGAGLEPTGTERTHGLHSPYWWLKCAVGPRNDEQPLVRAYHRLLVWDIVKRPRTTRAAEAVLGPTLGKSLVVYARKPS